MNGNDDKSPRDGNVTIFDVAREAHVSISSVSYAFNRKAGVSEKTRARILKVADKLGWSPNTAAKMLSTSRTGIIGLVLTASPDVLRMESFNSGFITGWATGLERYDYALLIRHAPSIDEEMRILQYWTTSHAVDGVVLQNIEFDDPRIKYFEQHREIPALALCDPLLAGSMITYCGDDRSIASGILDYLLGLGHSRIGRVTGPMQLGHTGIRSQAFRQYAKEKQFLYEEAHGDYTPDSGMRATTDLMGRGSAPTTIVYDNDLMAIAGCRQLQLMGYDVPGDVSVVAWDDSFDCRFSDPSITAIDHDLLGSAAQASDLLMRMVSGESVTPWKNESWNITRRQSTSRCRDSVEKCGVISSLTKQYRQCDESNNICSCDSAKHDVNGLHV